MIRDYGKGSTRKSKDPIHDSLCSDLPRLGRTTALYASPGRSLRWSKQRCYLVSFASKFPSHPDIHSRLRTAAFFANYPVWIETQSSRESTGRSSNAGLSSQDLYVLPFSLPRRNIQNFPPPYQPIITELLACCRRHDPSTPLPSPPTPSAHTLPIHQTLTQIQHHPPCNPTSK